MSGLEKAVEKFNNYELIKRRLSILVGSRWENKPDLLDAFKELKKIRKNFSKRCKGWNSTEEIKKWRERR